MTTVQVRHIEGLRLEGTSVSGKLAIDLAPGRGGTGTGVEPGELLLLALGGCMLHNMKIFADRNNIPLGAVEVELTGENSETAPKRFGRILIRFTLDGALTPADEARLLRVASRCKIHNTLEHPPTFEVAVERKAPRGR
jgi:putative redox protein